MESGRCEPETKHSVINGAILSTTTNPARALAGLWLITCGAITAINPFYALVLLIVWCYSRPQRNCADILITTSIVSYSYIVYFSVIRPGESIMMEAILLFVLNLTCLNLRYGYQLLINHLSTTLEDLRQEVNLDQLTGLYNREQIVKLGHSVFSRCLNQHKPMSILMINVDAPRELGECFGLPAREQTLIELTAILRQTLRNQDLCGRYSDDLFLLLLPDMPLGLARQTANRLRRRIAMHKVRYGEKTFTTTVTIGLAVIAKRMEAFNELFERAVSALQRAREQGGNLVLFGRGR